MQDEHYLHYSIPATGCKRYVSMMRLRGADCLAVGIIERNSGYVEFEMSTSRVEPGAAFDMIAKHQIPYDSGCRMGTRYEFDSLMNEALEILKAERSLS